ncbi:Carboxymuconolactone decarboxylase family protein [Amycolatopsis saalfeldensis]|uniref:Carboxymuconolactone decarboxylase family protein n=2 Tax=Amycolatopsis saalfeldensis TaxID=394193 RepID=A0A1H8YA16_9PSEU|nr:Carboxymuconolactone decarboxylase family protein [Amycolatopsis saalfeldensis]
MPSSPDRLGGRLPLLRPADLDEEQQQVHDVLTRIVVPEAAAGGFTARLADGRFIGPFNALLRAPRIALGLGAWTGRITEAGLAEDVRQAVILTVGSAWQAAYEIDAHVAAARAAGLPETAITALVDGTAPIGLSADADAAHRLTTSLLTGRGVPDELYAEAIGRFGEPGVVAILCLIGQYQTISSILVCFRVPVPPSSRSSASSVEQRPGLG